jgi:hypothetical protein
VILLVFERRVRQEQRYTWQKPLAAVVEAEAAMLRLLAEMQIRVCSSIQTLRSVLVS